MPAGKTFLFILITILFRLFCVAQMTIFEQTETHRQVIEYKGNPTQSNHSDFILGEIARSASKSPELTRLTIDFTSMIQVKRLDSLHFMVFCELKEMRISGDIYYRNINISHLLVPDYADFSVKVHRMKPLSEGVFRNQYTEISLRDNMGYFTILNTRFQDSEQGETYTAELSDINLSFGRNAAERFEKFTFLINEYFKSDAKINELNSIMKTIDLQVIEKVAFNNIVLRDVEKEFDKLVGYDFPNQLNLWKSDPIGFARRMNDLKQNIDVLRLQINSKIEQLDRLYYEYGLKAVASGKPDSADFFFRKATEFNPFFVPAITETARLYLQKGLNDSAMMKVLFIQENTFPASEELNALNELIRHVVSDVQETVNRKIASQDYVEAEYLLGFALRICTNSPETGCLDHTDKLMARVKYGLYTSILTVVEKASENKRFEIAWLYIQNALNYQQENRQYIITPIETEKYYAILFNAIRNEAGQLNSRKQFVRALELIEWTESLCDTVPRFNCSEIQTTKTVTLFGLYNERLDRIEQDIAKKNLQAAETRMKLLEDFVRTNPQLDFTERYRKAESGIYTSYYLSAISEAESNIEYGFYEPALKHLQKAKEIQETHFLKKHNNIDKLFQATVNPVLLKRYDNLIRNQSKYSIASLDAFLLENDEIEKSTGLVLSDTVIVLRNKLHNIVMTRTCDSIVLQIIHLKQKAEQLILRHLFTEADSLLLIAYTAEKNYQHCQLQDSGIEELLSKLVYGVEWERSNTEFEKLLSEQRWGEAIQKYVRVEELSSNQYLFMWGVERTALPQYIAGQRNVDFIIEGFRYFFESKQYDHAFLMLERLRLYAYPAAQTSDMQKKLGYKMAIRDKIQNPKSDYKMNILKYTEGEDYFLYFSTSYRKTWKKY